MDLHTQGQVSVGHSPAHGPVGIPWNSVLRHILPLNPTRRLVFRENHPASLVIAVLDQQQTRQVSDRHSPSMIDLLEYSEL